jgi:general secretion pathway protein A
MYNSYFGFKEKPFKLVPNPEYLFLSRSHEEALGHLKYAVSQGDGFVEIIGEVGTGKTTLCRAFLESLGENSVAAYIFNPRLGPKQLIKTINDEFGIQYDADNTKDLIDKLNAFLIRKKAERKRVIVIIDEAQNLSKTVLEQLRLLSNLETHQEKLLQIILVGQPELAEMLESHDLRQIGQRISLRYQIMPLSYEECREYIQFRLNIASHKRTDIFKPAAYRRIYNFSQGIPRLINIACDRALLTAFGLNRRRVTGRMARNALNEVGRRAGAGNVALMDGRKALAIFVLISAAVVVMLYHQTLGEKIMALFKTPAPGNAAVEIPEPAAAAKATPAAPPTPARSDAESIPAHAGAPVPAAEKPSRPFSDYLKAINTRTSRFAAIRNVLGKWGADLEPKPYLDELEDDATFFTLYAKTAGLLIHRAESDLRIIRNLNMPAVLELRTSFKTPPVYLTLTAFDGDKLLLKGVSESETIAISADDIWQNWTGVCYLPWKNFLALAGTIPTNAPPDSVLALKMILQESGIKNILMNKDYDPASQKAVEQIQAKYGVPVDGLVGNLTKIILYRELKAFDIPRLADD